MHTCIALLLQAVVTLRTREAMPCVCVRAHMRQSAKMLQANLQTFYAMNTITFIPDTRRFLFAVTSATSYYLIGFGSTQIARGIIDRTSTGTALRHNTRCTGQVNTMDFNVLSLLLVCVVSILYIKTSELRLTGMSIKEYSFEREH